MVVGILHSASFAARKWKGQAIGLPPNKFGDSHSRVWTGGIKRDWSSCKSRSRCWFSHSFPYL